MYVLSGLHLSVSCFSDCKWPCIFSLFHLFTSAPRLCCCSRASPSCGEQGPPPSCQAPAAHFGGSPVAEHGLWGPQAQQVQLGAQAQSLWGPDFAVPQHAGSSQTRDRTCVPCIGRWILYHLAPREARTVDF